MIVYQMIQFMFPRKELHYQVLVNYNGIYVSKLSTGMFRLS